MEKQSSIILNGFLSGSLIKTFFFFLSKASMFVFYFLILNLLEKVDADAFFEAQSLLLILSSIISFGLTYSAIKFFPIYLSKKDFNLIKQHVLFSFLLFFLAWLAVYFFINNLAAILDIFEGFILFLDRTFLTNISGFIFQAKNPFTTNYEKFISLLFFVWAGSLVLTIYYYFLSALNAFKKFFYSSFIEFLISFLKIFFFLFFVFLGLKNSFYAFISVLISFLLGLILSILIFLFDFKKLESLEKKIENKKFGFKELKNNILFGFPLFLNTFIEPLLGNLDILIIAYLLGDSPGAVAGYALITLFVRNIAPVILSPISAVQQVFLVEENEKGSELFYKITHSPIKWFVLLGLAVLGSFLVFGKLLLELIVPAYSNFYYLFWFFIPFIFADLLSASYRSALFAKGYSKILFLFYFFILLLNIVFDLILIPIFNVGGAALASSLAMIGGACFIIYFASKKLSISFDKNLWLIIFIFFLLAFSFSFLINYLSLFAISKISKILLFFVGLLAFLILYFGVFIYLKQIGKKEFEIILDFIKEQNLKFLEPVLKRIFNFMLKFSK
jgi:O-antigen/teichoic acid export membrane protein